MLNKEKVKCMTKAAAYENGPEKKNIGIGSYYRGDYLGLQMVKSVVAYTVSFGILAAMWAMGSVEELMLMLSRPEYVESILKVMILLFVAGLALYEIAVYAYYSSEYQRAKKSMGVFRAHLNHIHKFYETQESAGEDSHTDTRQADGENTL